MEKERFDKIVDLLMKQMELKNEFSREFVENALLAVQKFDSKNSEKNLDSYNEFGGIAVLIKMADKFAELKAAYKNNKKDADKISLWENCAVYSIIGKIIESKK